MQQGKNTILFSPSDLNAFLECEHLTQLELAVARHEIARPADENPQADLVKRKGDEHEAAYLARLLADGRDVTTILNDWDLDAAARPRPPTMAHEKVQDDHHIRRKPSLNKRRFRPLFKPFSRSA